MIYINSSVFDVRNTKSCFLDKYRLCFPAISRRIRFLFAALLVTIPAVLTSGCGGGGGNGSIPSGNASSYTLVERASGTVGSEINTISNENLSLEAALASQQKVTISERFYTTGRPQGAIGKIFDIQPDGLQFLEGTRLCFSISGTGYGGNDLTIMTGAGLDQPLETFYDARRNRVCAYLSHSSPYSLYRAKSLNIPEYSIFGSLDAKDKYKYTVSESEADNPNWGHYYEVKIDVFCNLQCMESGERVFRFMQGVPDAGKFFGPLADDLFLVDDGSYPLWRDMETMPWIHLRSTGGTVIGGIAYLLAAEYVKYFIGGGRMDGYIAQLDPPQNSMTRFFYKNGAMSPHLKVEISRDESTMPDMIRIVVWTPDRPERTFMVNRLTAAITKSWVSTMDGSHSVSVSPADKDYDKINTEVLYYIYELLGLDDTPDETAGNSHDEFQRYLPIQELFTVNIMNLLKGLGWHNLEAIEAYYRDRLKVWKNNPPPQM